MFSDLECDYINPIDLCSQLNRVRVLRSSPVTRTFGLILTFHF